jgi:plastocyanin
VWLGLAGSAALAAEHEIKIKNTNGKGKFMAFEPEFLKVEPGDTVKFVIVDKNHNAEAIKEVWPEGFERRDESERRVRRREARHLRPQMPPALHHGWWR